MPDTVLNLRICIPENYRADNKLSFDYINKILLTWQENGYTTVKNVRDAENSYKKTKKTPVRSGESASDVDKYKVVINKF